MATATSGSQNEIILYHYLYSPYAKRVVWYLALRGIPYSQCMQPAILPRPDVSALGVSYRRIPILAIGGDVYCDTRLILSKLEKLYPEGALGVSDPDQKALERLLEKWTIETIFSRAALLIPTNLPLLKDPKFQADRKAFSGRNWDEKAMLAARPEAETHIHDAFAFLEATLLADGRDWILKTEKPSLADIEAIFPFHWLSTMPGALPPSSISAKQFPRVFDWIKRFDQAVKQAGRASSTPTTLKGDIAAEKILNGNHTSKISINSQDPSGLQEGQQVQVFPIDSGRSHKDQGRLIGLNEEEIVMEKKVKGDKVLHLHFPRLNFTLTAIGDNAARL